MPPRSVQHTAGRSSPAAAAAAAATPRPLCHHFLRGCCRYGAACRFSHDVQAASRTSLPFGDRKYVGAEQAAPPPPPPGADSGQRQRPASAPTAGGRHGSWPLRVMSFNVLADCLAREHAAELYTSAPRWSLEWSFRGPRIVKEIVHWRPDVACLQEVDVDCFDELEQALRRSGYAGWFTKRTGDRRDGLALFWLADKLCAAAQQHIQFRPLGLKDNVAQLAVFHWRERRDGGARHDSRDSNRPAGSPTLVVANFHGLFNPKRGDIKLSQVRILFEQVHGLCQQLPCRSGTAHGCPAAAVAVVCGDWNSAPGSPIYSFIRDGALDLSRCDRRRMSGQVEAKGHNWRALQQAFLKQRQSAGTSACDASEECSGQDGGSTSKSLRPWSADDLLLAAGSASDGHVARHALKVESAYLAVTGGEAAYTTCHDKFIGTVDLILYTREARGGWRLEPVGVLLPPPLETLHCALPSPAWPSDHISLVADFSLTPAEPG